MTDEQYALLPDWCRDMLAGWQGCGPWVPDADLTPEGQAIKAAFLWMLASDTRYTPEASRQNLLNQVSALQSLNLKLEAERDKLREAKLTEEV